jgi:ABC-2 type transport system permease protein
MKSLLRLYLSGIRLAFLTRISDRVDFGASLLVMLGVELLPVVVTALVYGQGLAFPGWSLHEAILLQGILLIAKGLTYPVFAGMAWMVSERVREGTFELLLLKPRHPLVLCIVTAYDAEDLGKLAGGAALCAYALSHLRTPATEGILFFCLLMVFSAMCFAACLILMTALLMLWVGNFRIYEIFETLVALGQYPPVVLPGRVRQAALAPFPILGLAVLPACALLGRSTAGWIWAASASGGLLGLSLWIWNRMMRRIATAGG